MLSYTVRRVLLGLIALLGASLIIFSMVHLTPGDPVRTMLKFHASSERVATLRQELGLDQPLPKQYLDFLWGAIRGNFGKSLSTRRPVISEIAERIIPTLKLAFTGMGIAITIGITAGVLAAAFKDTIVDELVMVIAVAGVSIPSFWLGLMLIQVFVVNLNWLPLTEGTGFRSLILPAISLGLLASAVIARLTRSNMVEVLTTDYVRTARAKGVKDSFVLFKHALRNALIPVITIIGIQIGVLLGGTVVIEKVFAWPGLGRLLINAIYSRDYPLIQAIVLYLAAGFISLNLLVDLIYAFLDPRIRYD